MSELRDSLDEYLKLRRSLGYKLERAGKVLADFVDFLDDTSATHISVGLAMAWAIQAPGAESSWRAGRLAMVRGFARYLKAIDTRHQVPPTGLIPRRRGRPTPYLFSAGCPKILDRPHIHTSSCISMRFTSVESTCRDLPPTPRAGAGPPSLQQSADRPVSREKEGSKVRCFVDLLAS